MSNRLWMFFYAYLLFLFFIVVWDNHRLRKGMDRAILLIKKQDSILVSRGG